MVLQDGPQVGDRAISGVGEAVWDALTMTPLGSGSLLRDVWQVSTGRLTREEVAAQWGLAAEVPGQMVEALRADPVGFVRGMIDELKSQPGAVDWVWPRHSGAVSDSVETRPVALGEPISVDRIGGKKGTFFTEPNAPFGTRSLPRPA